MCVNDKSSIKVEWIVLGHENGREKGLFTSEFISKVTFTHFFVPEHKQPQMIEILYGN